MVKALGGNVDLRSFRNSEIFHIQGVGEQEMIEQAYGNLAEITDDHPNVLITLSPVYSDFYPTPDTYRKSMSMLEIEPRLEIVLMREYMPAHKGQEDVNWWYNLPHDSHFSDYGATIYAEAMVGVVKRRLQSSQGSNRIN